MRRITLLTLALVSVALMGASCSVGGSPKPQAVNDAVTGGIWVTADQGVTWKQRGLISTTAPQKLNILNLDASVLVADPSDSQALYLGTFGDGVFYSYDGGAGWQVMLGLGRKGIIDLAVDPKDKCNLYASTPGKIYKSVDCGRTWQEAYSDNDRNQLIYSIVVDHFNPDILYMANTRGDVIKSLDAGKTWRTLVNFKTDIKKLVMDPKNSRVLFAVTANKGIEKSLDGGASWQDLEPRLKELKADRGFRDFTASPSQPGLYFLAVDYGLLKTANYGDDWSELKLIVPEKKSFIKAVAVNPTDAKKIYYVTETTFYGTTDGGDHWSSLKLPTPRQGAQLIVSAAKGNPIYLGVKTK
jgi:photosystem II stability/assembly factor-like uncharacterized protein